MKYARVTTVTKTSTYERGIAFEFINDTPFSLLKLLDDGRYATQRPEEDMKADRLQ